MPYRKYNCFQLVQLILREQYEIELPDPPVDMGQGIESLSNSIESMLGKYVEPQQLQEPIDGCMVLMNASRNLNHLGLYLDVQGEGYIIHAFAFARQSICHPISDIGRYGLNLDGYYAWL